MEFKKKSMEELERLDAEKKLAQSHFPITIILDNVRSMNNVGSVFRTADGFNIEKIILAGLTPQPPHRDIQKTALGATESVHWQHYECITDAIQELKNKNYTIIGIEQVHNSIPLGNTAHKNHERIALIFGNEVEGVSEEALNLCDFCIEIPQFGSKHSLNISVSAGIVMWEFVREMQL